MQKYTATNSYFATGEGMTHYLLYMYAESEVGVVETFVRLYGEYFAHGIEVREGFDTTCNVAKLLLPAKVQALMESTAGNFRFSASLHVNYS